MSLKEKYGVTDSLINAVKEAVTKGPIARTPMEVLEKDLNEAKKKLHPNKQKLDVHEPEKDELTAKDFEMLRKRKKVAKKEVEESTDVTDYNPKSQGGTRKELLTKYSKTKNPKDAETARRAGATQKELKLAKEEVDIIEEEEFNTSPVPRGKYVKAKLRDNYGTGVDHIFSDGSGRHGNAKVIGWKKPDPEYIQGLVNKKLLSKEKAKEYVPEEIVQESSARIRLMRYMQDKKNVKNPSRNTNNSEKHSEKHSEMEKKEKESEEKKTTSESFFQNEIIERVISGIELLDEKSQENILDYIEQNPDNLLIVNNLIK